MLVTGAKTHTAVYLNPEQMLITTNVTAQLNHPWDIVKLHYLGPQKQATELKSPGKAYNVHFLKFHRRSFTDIYSSQNQGEEMLVFIIPFLQRDVRFSHLTSLIFSYTICKLWVKYQHYGSIITTKQGNTYLIPNIISDTWKVFNKMFSLFFKTYLVILEKERNRENARMQGGGAEGQEDSLKQIPSECIALCRA